MTLFVLPGMGADSSMYGGPWMKLENAVFLDWPKYGGEESLEDLAERIARENDITQSDVVAGSSMGGMVALEIAEQQNIQQVILIGSARTRAEINPLLMLLAPLAKITPLKLSQTLSGSSSSGIGEKLMRVEPEFIKAMCL